MELDLDLELEGEIYRFIKVWTTIVTSLTYCYLISRVITKSKIRLFCFLPIICIFVYLPLTLNSINLSVVTGLLIAWLGNFKLLLFAFDKGPLSSNPSLSLPCFILIACLPITIKQNPPPHPESGAHNKGGAAADHSSSSSLQYAIKVFVLVLLLYFHGYRHGTNTYVFLCLCCIYIFYFLEIVLATFAAIARSLLGLELERPFNSPHLSTSPQDFWGKRWNLIVSNILRKTVYEHVRPVYSRAFGKRLGLSLAVVTTFLVSGLMHELIFIYITRLRPNWEVLLWFFFYGVCLALEIEVKKKVEGRWELHRFVSRPLTIGFVFVTCYFWIFSARTLHSGADVKSITEHPFLRMMAEYPVAWKSVRSML